MLLLQFLKDLFKNRLGSWKPLSLFSLLSLLPCKTSYQTKPGICFLPDQVTTSLLQYWPAASNLLNKCHLSASTWIVDSDNREIEARGWPRSAHFLPSPATAGPDGPFQLGRQGRVASPSATTRGELTQPFQGHIKSLQQSQNNLHSHYAILALCTLPGVACRSFFLAFSKIPAFYLWNYFYIFFLPTKLTAAARKLPCLQKEEGRRLSIESATGWHLKYVTRRTVLAWCWGE